GHRRLSIVDLKTGQQPLSNEDGSIWVIFNGEIYNHGDIRRDLQARGHRYRTLSDTESIVHAYEEWGDECVHAFRGMFAFAVWDSTRRRLLLVRDRLGVKPLYWARHGDRLLFGSEIKAILASGVIEPEPRLAALPELLGTRTTTGDQTLFKGIHKLEPGHRLVFEGGRTTISQYWDVPTGHRPKIANTREAVERFRDLFTESVKLRLMSDVPLGVFLSGGLDSSAIAATMSTLVDQPIKTFSVAFSERAFSELTYSREVANAVGADAHEIVIDDCDFFGALPRLVWHEDEPIAHPSSVPLYFVSALAKRHVTVVLTGEGSDELLAGYGRYPRIQWNWRAGRIYDTAVPGGVRAAIAQRLVPRLPPRLARFAGRSFLGIDRRPESMVFDSFAAVRLCEQRSLLSDDYRHMATAGNAYGASLTYFNRPPSTATLLDRLLYADMKSYLVELLMKQDQMSMAASIESRVPFLDHKLVEFAVSLPDAWKLSGLTTKRVLREAAKTLLPPSILTRPKMGFPVPLQSWLRSEWNAVAADVLLDSRARQRGIIDVKGVEMLLRDHASGRIDGTDRIWSLLNLELWFRTFIDKEGVQTLGSRGSRSDVHEYSVA
ncbi:MAG TPA: asparagine synthase (glutamine-hydrolyzing), partial [Vicinamibacterales bacterium]|nr:asparagine synthase (glutamine-hydrolyzing) [Vicinamibacterales bacterium]